MSAKGALDPVWPGSGSDPHSSLPIFLSPIGAIFSLHRGDQSFIIVELSVPLSRRRWPDGFEKQIRHIHDRKVHDHLSEVRASSH